LEVFLAGRSVRRYRFRAPQILSGKSEQEADKFLAEGFNGISLSHKGTKGSSAVTTIAMAP
jgi:hypothetical protein